MAPGTRGDAQDQGQTEVCIHFLNGRCRHGAACRRRHDPAAARPPCTYFQRGFCNRGDDCLFAHGPSDTAARLAPASQAAPLRRGPQTAPPMQPQRRRQLAAQLAAAAPPAAQGLSVWRYLDAEELNKKLDEEERLMEGYCSEDAPSSLSSSEDEGEAAAAGGEGGEGSRDSKRGQDSSARDARWRAWAARLEEWEAERERREIQLERRLLRKDADKTVTDEFRPLCWSVGAGGVGLWVLAAAAARASRASPHCRQPLAPASAALACRCETCQRGFSQPKALLSHLTSQHAGSQDALIAQLAAARCVQQQGC